MRRSWLANGNRCDVAHVLHGVLPVELLEPHGLDLADVVVALLVVVQVVSLAEVLAIAMLVINGLLPGQVVLLLS